jgi:hypothetical protein
MDVGKTHVDEGWIDVAEEVEEAELTRLETEDAVVGKLVVLTEVDKVLEEVNGGEVVGAETMTLASTMAWRTIGSTQDVVGVE